MNFISRFVDTTFERLENLVVGGSRGIVAVSGGADSVALFRALRSRLDGLIVAHFNHQLRPESDADAQWVRDLASGCTYREGTANVLAQLQAGEGVEAAARRLRYDFLTTIARESGAAWIATAHTRDDQVETILHRFIRGAGFWGLRGMPEHRELAPGVRLIRPILSLSRSDVIGYLREIGQNWREDASNRDLKYTRNRIRHELIPMLQTFNSTVDESVLQLSVDAQEMVEYIEQNVADLISRIELPKAGNVCLLKKPLSSQQSEFELREVLRFLWRRERWPEGQMNRDHWVRIARMIRDGNADCDLPDAMRIEQTPYVVRIGLARDFQ